MLRKFKFALYLLTILVSSCSKELPIIEDLSQSNYKLLTQDSVAVNFPQFLNGTTFVIGYIFTNCPDICPLTTNNMRLIQEKLVEENLRNVEFVGLSFDPDMDTPTVLRKYAEIRNLDTSNWTFLTGEKETIKSLLKKVEVFAMPSDSSITDGGKKFKYFIHTDRISLVDSEGRIRKNYSGSKISIDEIVIDIKTIYMEE